MEWLQNIYYIGAIVTAVVITYFMVVDNEYCTADIVPESLTVILVSALWPIFWLVALLGKVLKW